MHVKHWVIFAGAFVGAVFSVACASMTGDEPRCASARACVAQIERVAAKGHELTDSEYALAERIQSHGGKAVDRLIPLLDSGDEDVRNFVAYTLWRIDGLEPRHVKPILAAALRETYGGSLPWVLARIDSPDAIDALMQLLRKDPVAASPIGAALQEAGVYEEFRSRGLDPPIAYEGLGARVISALSAVVTSTAPQEDELLRAAIEILREIGFDKPTAQIPLVHFALDRTRSLDLRTAAIYALGTLEGKATDAREPLRTLAEADESELSVAANAALFLIDGPGPETRYALALAPLERRDSGRDPAAYLRIEEIAGYALFDKMAELGEPGARARGAARELVRLTSTGIYADVRVQAAWTIGYLGDPSTGPVLVSLLHDPDWLLVAAAAGSLERLGDAAAIDSLEAVAASHWFPPVRAVARDAVAALESHVPPSNLPSTIYFHESSLHGPNPEPCANAKTDPPARPGEQVFSLDLNPDDASRHVYTLDNLFGLEPGALWLDVTPSFGTRVAGGWLLGNSRGEFGGELVYAREGEPVRTVARGNFEAVHRMGGGQWVATSGLAHMGFDGGDLYELREKGDGWAADWWRRLPGSPTSSWSRIDGTLLVNTTRGSVVVHPDGRLEMAACTASERDSRESADE